MFYSILTNPQYTKYYLFKNNNIFFNHEEKEKSFLADTMGCPVMQCVNAMRVAGLKVAARIGTLVAFA